MARRPRRIDGPARQSIRQRQGGERHEDPEGRGGVSDGLPERSGEQHEALCKTVGEGLDAIRNEKAALWLEHIANNDPRSFGDEQASLGCALSACSSTDEYDFAFEAIHFVLHLLEERWYWYQNQPAVVKWNRKSITIPG